MPEDAYAAVAKDYDAGYAGPYWEVYDHVTRETAAPFLPAKDGHVLDAGAGTGKFALWMLARGARVTLLDPSAEMLEVARRKIEAEGLAERASFVVGGIEKLDLPDAAFDAVFCEGDPLSYCRTTYAQAARELLRVLRPGGGFYVSCDSRWYTTALHLAGNDVKGALALTDTGETRDRYGIPVRAFDPQELRRVFDEAGARDVRVSGKVVLLNFMSAEGLQAALQDPAQRERVLALELKASQDPTMAGMGGHLQVTGRR